MTTAHAVTITAGDQHTCAVVNGGVQCWGSNGVGQLGNNTRVPSFLPVIAIPTGSNVTAIAVGSAHSCAGLNGGIVCWGSNSQGQLANANTGVDQKVAANITTFLPPTAPVITATTVEATSVTLTFTPPASNGGSAISGYLATCTRTSGFGSATGNATAAATSITIGGLTTNAAYTCSVTAMNIAGSGPASNSVNATPVVVAPPSVSISTPLNNASLPQGPVTIGISAQAGAGLLSKIDLFDGTTLLTSVSPPAVSSFTTNYVWTGMSVGSHTLTATATNTQGGTVTSAPVTVTITAPPVASITITAPANNASIGNTGTTDIIVNASVAPNSIRKIELFDGTTLLTTDISPASPALSTLSFTYGWAGMGVGSHTLTAKVTDNQGTVSTSAAITVQVRAGPTITLSTLSNFALAGSTIDLNATTAPAAPATIAKVEFFADNGTTNQLIGTVTAAPYAFRWQNVTAGSYVLTAKATDSQGISTVSAPVNMTVGGSVSIAFAQGLNGSTANEDTTQVSGTVSAPPNSAVNINGQLATVTGGGQFFLNDLNLQAGANTVTATVTTVDGQTANQVITITRSATAATFVVTVTSSGIATPTSPFIADITIANPNNVPFSTVTVVCSDPGPGADFPAATVSFTCSYTDAGTYSVRVLVKDEAGAVIYSGVKMVTVVTPQSIYTSIASIYNEVTDRLKVGNIDGALNAFTRGVREKYRAAFVEVGGGLPELVNSFGVISGASINTNFAELIIVKTTAQGDVAVPVILGMGTDGIWRIDGF